jgi:hypothetical protein
VLEWKSTGGYGQRTLSTFGGVGIASMLFKLDIARGYLMIALPIGVVATLCGRRLARQQVTMNRRKHGSSARAIDALADPADIDVQAKMVLEHHRTHYDPAIASRRLLEIFGDVRSHATDG